MFLYSFRKDNQKKTKDFVLTENNKIFPFSFKRKITKKKNFCERKNKTRFVDFLCCEKLDSAFHAYCMI